MFTTLFSIVHLAICILLIVLILLQQGKGADAGATFGGGNSTMFGAAGADTFLTKFTTMLAIGFFISSITLALDLESARATKGSSVLDKLGTTGAVNETTDTAISTDADSSDATLVDETNTPKTKVDGTVKTSPAVSPQAMAPEKGTNDSAPSSAKAINSDAESSKAVPAKVDVSDKAVSNKLDNAKSVVSKGVQKIDTTSKEAASAVANPIEKTSDSISKTSKPLLEKK